MDVKGSGMRVTEKGQVTIPKHIRDRLGIGPGSEVEFVEHGDVVHLERGKMERQKDEEAFDEWLERYRGKGISGLSADEYMALIRDQDIPLPDLMRQGGFHEDTD